MDQRSAIEIGRKYLLLLLQRNYPVKRMFLYGFMRMGIRILIAILTLQ